MFVTVWMNTARWSATPLVIVPGPGNTRLFHHSPVRRYVAVHPTVDAALEQLAGPPPRRRTVLWLPPSRRSVDAARGFVTDACHNWHIDPLTANATAVVGELVANAVRHAGSPISVRLELREAKLTIAVSDDEPRPVRWPPPTARSQVAVSGLPLVMRLSDVCGCATHSGGKIVWAVLKYDAAPVESPLPDLIPD